MCSKPRNRLKLPGARVGVSFSSWNPHSISWYFILKWRSGFDNARQHGYLVQMKTSNISYLRNHLSEVLSCVKEGETVLVLDRKKPVACLISEVGA
jgi:hypothetical protein